MSLYGFQILGSLPQHDAVVGSLSSGLKGARGRIILIVPTEGLSDHKRREKIQCAKNDLAAGGLIAFADSGADNLKDIFARGAENDVKAPLSNPEYIQQTIDLLLKETNQPLITLDAQNRESFWAALRVMGAESQDMFAVAELGALKPEAKSKRVSKPIGEAHIVCGDLVKHKDLFPYTDHSVPSLINMIRRSQKIKLPDIDLDKQVIGAHFLRELERNLNTHKSAAVSIGHFIGKLRHSFLRSRGEEGNVVFFKPRISPETMNKFSRKMADANGIDAQYAKKMADFLYYNVVRGDPYEELKKVFIDFHDFDPDEFDFDTLTRKFDKNSMEQLQFRNGIHVSPYDLAFFETDVRDSRDGHIFTFGSLVEKDDFGMTIYNFFRSIRKDGFYIPHSHKMCVRFDANGQASNIAVIDMESGKVLTTGESAGIHSAADMAFAHTLSAIARMNEPGFAPVIYETNRRGSVDAKKGKFPYFDYIGMESFGVATSHISVGPKGALEATDSIMRRHLVRGHPRRFRDDVGNIREIIMVPMHMRGDEKLGFVSKSHELK